MSPDELRAHADLIADRYNIQDGEPALWRAMVHVVQAARNLADVIEYAELRAWCHENGVLHIGGTRIYQTPEETVAHVVRLARGDTNERESNDQ